MKTTWLSRQIKSEGSTVLRAVNDLGVKFDNSIGRLREEFGDAMDVLVDVNHSKISTGPSPTSQVPAEGDLRLRINSKRPLSPSSTSQFLPANLHDERRHIEARFDHEQVTVSKVEVTDPAPPAKLARIQTSSTQQTFGSSPSTAVTVARSSLFPCQPPINSAPPPLVPADHLPQLSSQVLHLCFYFTTLFLSDNP